MLVHAIGTAVGTPCHPASRLEWLQAREQEAAAQRDATAAQLAALQLERGQLESHNAALQQLQATKDEMEAVLQAGAAPPAKDLAAGVDARSRAGSGSIFGLEELARSSPAAAGSDGPPPRLISGLLLAHDGPDEMMLRPGYPDDPLDLQLAASALPDALRRAALGPPGELLEEWRKYAVDMRECLAEYDACGCPRAEARMKQRLQQMGVAMTLAMQKNPAAMRVMWQHGTPPRPPPGSSAAELAAWDAKCRAMYSDLPQVRRTRPISHTSTPNAGCQNGFGQAE